MSDDPPKPTPPNLDLIQMVQAARLAHDAGVLPSQVQGVYWLEVKRETAGPDPTSRAGRWVIETTADAADIERVRAALVALGVSGPLRYDGA